MVLLNKKKLQSSMRRVLSGCHAGVGGVRTLQVSGIL